MAAELSARTYAEIAEAARQLDYLSGWKSLSPVDRERLESSQTIVAAAVTAIGPIVVDGVQYALRGGLIVRSLPTGGVECP